VDARLEQLHVGEQQRRIETENADALEIFFVKNSFKKLTNF
jgi:hypothetical protein